MNAEQFYEQWRKTIVYHRVGPMDFKPDEAFQFAETYAALKTAQMVLGRERTKDEHDAILLCLNIVYDACKSWEERCRDQVSRMDSLEDSTRQLECALVSSQAQVDRLEAEAQTASKSLADMRLKLEAAEKRILNARKPRRR